MLLLFLPGAASARCAGDCGGDQRVTVDELLTLVNIALGNAPLTRCSVGDADGDGRISVAEIINAVNRSLGGCPPQGCVQPPVRDGGLVSHG